MHLHSSMCYKFCIKTLQQIVSQDRYKRLADTCVELFGDSKIILGKIEVLETAYFSLGLAEKQWEGNSFSTVNLSGQFGTLIIPEKKQHVILEGVPQVIFKSCLQDQNY